MAIAEPLQPNVAPEEPTHELLTAHAPSSSPVGSVAKGALALLSTRHVGRAVLVMLAVIYFAGYPAVQFQVRHFFHLEFVVWLGLLQGGFSRL